ncbi:hypothetical protein PISMIDRAFT_676172 [Pisolithus microcarpus 441]|uniref:Uncharacterized protein n=1 Tax=Pisolithus microcarpus 441 TaxID=765257 RepID=A0A0C9ZVU6_9AGAM|nr:hypothetical protein PISMIDRAFT_676172 [Pisolithus microcarpus 441]
MDREMSRTAASDRVGFAVYQGIPIQTLPLRTEAKTVRHTLTSQEPSRALFTTSIP